MGSVCGIVYISNEDIAGNKKMIEQIFNDPFWKAMLVVVLFTAGIMMYAGPKMWRDDRRLSRSR